MWCCVKLLLLAHCYSCWLLCCSWLPPSASLLLPLIKWSLALKFIHRLNLMVSIKILQNSASYTLNTTSSSSSLWEGVQLGGEYVSVYYSKYSVYEIRQRAKLVGGSSDIIITLLPESIVWRRHKCWMDVGKSSALPVAHIAHLLSNLPRLPRDYPQK